MLQLFSDDRRRIGTLSGFSDLKETTKLNSGDKEISFKYPQSGAFFDDIRNEYYIRTKTDEYVIKSISGGSKTQWLKVIATLNLEDLEGKAFKNNMTEATIMAQSAASGASTAATMANSAAAACANIAEGINSMTDDTTAKVYSIGIDNGIIYLKEE